MKYFKLCLQPFPCLIQSPKSELSSAGKEKTEISHAGNYSQVIFFLKSTLKLYITTTLKRICLRT